MATGSVIQLYDILATCPDCQNQKWEIHVDGFLKWENIKKFTCSACGFFVEMIIQMEEVEEECKALV